MSIVSVYCKSLLRLFIVGVYCKYLLCFIVFSVQNVARSLVLLRFRLQKLLFECVLLCFCSRMCKKHYKTNQKSCFLHINSPNPLFYRCKLLAMFISRCNVSKPLFIRHCRIYTMIWNKVSDYHNIHRITQRHLDQIIIKWREELVELSTTEVEYSLSPHKFLFGR